jgi:hypothetical protein
LNIFVFLSKEEEIEADKIFVTSSLAEAMYLLEQCTDLAINNVSFVAWCSEFGKHITFMIEILKSEVISELLMARPTG